MFIQEIYSLRSLFSIGSFGSIDATVEINVHEHTKTLSHKYYDRSLIVLILELQLLLIYVIYSLRSLAKIGSLRSISACEEDNQREPSQKKSHK